MKRKKPIARLVPVPEKSAEILVLEIGRIFNEAGITEKEALTALDLARKEIYGSGDNDLLIISPESLIENGIYCRIITPQDFIKNVS